MKPRKSASQGFCNDLSFSNKLRNQGKSNEAFEVMLSALTLEEIIGLKLECSSRLTGGKMYGFNLWSNIVDITKEALYNAVIVKPQVSEETTYGSIIVPDLGKEVNEIGEVVSVGPGQTTITGELIPSSLKIGDIVVLPTQGFTKIPYDGEEYYVGPENQVLAKINKKADLGEALNDTLENISEEEINQIKDISNE